MRRRKGDKEYNFGHVKFEMALTQFLGSHTKVSRRHVCLQERNSEKNSRLEI